MCGRAACSLGAQEVCRKVKATRFDGAQHYKPTYNLCPQNFAPILIAQEVTTKKKEPDTSPSQAMFLSIKKEPSTENPNSKIKIEPSQLPSSPSIIDLPLKRENEEDTLKTLEKKAMGRVLQAMQWGLQPSWSKKLLINARAETLASSRTFGSLLQRQRCVLVCDGYYEWQRSKIQKMPHYFTDPTQPILLLAAVYEQRKDRISGTVQTRFAVITVPVASHLAHIHDRMPAVLHDEDQLKKWIQCKVYSPGEALSCLQPSSLIRCHPVSDLVSKRGDGPDLIKPLVRADRNVKDFFTRRSPGGSGPGEGSRNLPVGGKEALSLQPTIAHLRKEKKKGDMGITRSSLVFSKTNSATQRLTSPKSKGNQSLSPRRHQPSLEQFGFTRSPTSKNRSS